MVYGQESLKVDRFLLVKIEDRKNTEMKAYVVPEGEVWSIESGFTHLETKTIFIAIDEVEYHIPFGEKV